jgi:outer membrane protein assembly factor BamB
VKRHLLAGILTLSALSAGCATQDKAPKTGPVQPVPVNTFQKAWYTDLGLGSATATNVYVFDNYVIIYGSDNTAHVVDRQSGSLKWIHQLPKNAGDQHTPSVFGDRIVYPATSALKVYSTKTGRLLKDMSVTYAISAGGAGMGQFYYVAANYPNGGRLVALDLDRAESLPRWEVMTVAPMRSTPIHLNSITFFASEGGAVRAVNEQRASVWGLSDTLDGGFKCGGPVYADLAADNAYLYVASMDTKLYCLAQSSGKIKWQFYAWGIPLQDKPDVTSDTVYQKVRGKGLVAISKAEGKDFRDARWTNAETDKFLADDDKHTYVLSRDGRITALDKATGKAQWNSKSKDFVAFGTNLKDGSIYAVNKWGQLVCIKAVTKVGVVGEVVMDDSRPLEVASR